MSDEPRIVIGVDPGTALTGYGIVAQRSASGGLVSLAFGTIATSPRDELPWRVQHIYRELCELIGLHRPAEMAIEKIYFSRNVRSALAVGQARGVALLAAAQAGLAVYEYSPQEIKQAVTAHGQASKEQVQEGVRLLLGLSQVPQPDDAADALAAAICHLQHAPWALRVARLEG